MTWHAQVEVGSDLMRHPIDSSIWKAENLQHPEFAQESRNVRLGISIDGFNPFGNLSTSHSIWPVFVVPYNLPLSLCMRKEFSILSLLIPWPKAPSNDIDIFLAPLVEELNDLWIEGLKAFDSFKQETFTLRVMLLWAIYNFPAYWTLSGCNVHGYLGCPICGEETEATYLADSQKLFYHSHQRFLPPGHKFRTVESNFLPEGVEQRLAPRKLSGEEVETKSALVFQALRGKHPKFLTEKHKLKDDGVKVAWSRRSILFDLPHWKNYSVRHVLDIMHVEKNIIEHIVGTCIIGSHSKDGVNARKDLRKLKIKRSLWLKEDPNTRRITMPAGAFSLSIDERKMFLSTLFNLKVPSNFSSNLRRVVHHATHDLKQCKSHDWHVIMQLVPLLFGHCFTKHKDLRKAIMQASTYLCICVTALQCGPVRYLWMYPFERLMKTFKDYVKNTRYVEGSIVEEYITEEASMYAKEYIPNAANGKLVTLTSVQYEQVTRYVFETYEAIEHWKEKYKTSEAGRKRKKSRNINNEFRIWLLKSGDALSTLARFSRGPDFVAKEYAKYRLNGFMFSSSARESKLVGKQNSGISINALTYFRASSKDKRLVEVEMMYYGIIRQILVLDYFGENVTIFYGDWVKVEDKTTCMVDLDTNMVMVDLNKMKSKDHINDEPFVCAFQNHKQVCYAKSPKDGPSLQEKTLFMTPGRVK